MTSLQQNKLAIRGIIGLFQGIYIYALIEVMQKHLFTGLIASYILVPQLLILIFVPVLLIQGLGNMRTATLTKWGISAAILIAGTSCYSIYRQTVPGQLVNPESLSVPSFEYCLTLLIALFIAQSLILSSEADHKFRANYPTYFDLSWKLALQVISTWAFSGVFWGLLFLGAGLFEVIHLHFFTTLITSTWFSCIASSLSVAAGIHATDVSVRMIQGVRTMILVLLSWLLPLITIIIALFLTCLIFMGLEPLWQTRYAAALLIATVIIFVLLINATFQDGTKIVALNHLHQLATRLACCLLLPLMLLAAYALYLRVAQYGWTVTRIHSAIIMLILFSYSIGYLLAALAGREDLSFIASCNFATALLVLAMALAISTPIADPVRLMVNNQVSRLTSGAVSPDHFDFVSLRFKGGRYGYVALTELQSSWQGANADTVKTAIKDALSMSTPPSHLNPKKTSTDYKRDITIHTPNTTIPESFINQPWGEKYQPNTPSCLTFKSAKCDAWITEDKQNRIMIVIRDWSSFTAFQQNTAGIWEVTGFWQIPTSCTNAISKAIKTDKVKFGPPEPQGQDIIADSVRLPFASITNCN